MTKSTRKQSEILRPKVIKTDRDHQRALARVEELFAAKPGTPEGDELELWLLLVEKYEEAAFPVELPSPIEAIRFRMDQANLKQSDLIPFLGGKSKVSEVLNGKRDLSLTMIRKLHEHLGIPAEVLLQEPDATLPDGDFLELGKRFPLSEMVKRGWLEGIVDSLPDAKAQIEDVLVKFAAPVGDPTKQPVFNRQNAPCGNPADSAALVAWQIRVMSLAKRQKQLTYRKGTVDEDFLREVVRLSLFDHGPALAQEFLFKHGIHLIVEGHLPKTFLDGAAIRLSNDGRLIALTLRYDRLDNFWFVLLHELAHIALHIDTEVCEAVFDNLDERGTDRIEREADELAKEALISSSEWKAARLTRKSTVSEIKQFAERMRIHPAIPAGRIRFESDNYRILTQLLGNRQVRKQFG
ncbi:HTH-type transcriptional regulator / antitoxin HigA [Neorhodopirellula lusitana]|uniref:HTH-type transcriptional regulator / antitoxin HigA n=1 Tax=Neorhodopirellula lusitana TaxID=445327 RepID=A0ABY1QH48_9BACT|nr:ImmA/IrrE family metallo-endopeptidase [Neorhodopirellula lusitana]SMP68295.1 HTH-type transcriptional regulator / antitoxin HigA [Neorhodopirellula lusitana]